ncbi:hypothetical protein BHM03_00024889 [Ensete ventricosum]|nr:hypothetical protein BHM03_00024889 [Ensete ventricosum]
MNIRSGIGWRLTVTSNNLLLACDHCRTREVGKPDPLLACDHYCIVEVEKPDPCLCQRHGDVEVKLDTASIQVVEVKIASAQDKALGSLILISALDMEVEITSARDVVGREA